MLLERPSTLDLDEEERLDPVTPSLEEVVREELRLETDPSLFVDLLEVLTLLPSLEEVDLLLIEELLSLEDTDERLYIVELLEL